MSDVLELLSLKNPVFQTYLFWGSVLGVKMLGMTILTVVQRFKNKAVASPEDSPKGIVKVSEDVERVRRAHLNDLENIPLFLAVAFFYQLTNPSPTLAINLIRVASCGRILHSFAYTMLAATRPRGMGFGLCFLTTAYMAVSTAIHFL